MSVEDTSPKIYNCNGSVTSFAAGFIDIESFGASALQSEHVTVIHWDDVLEIEEELTITTEYTISGTNIVTVATYPTNDKIAILPEYDYLQSFEFTASPYLDTGSLEIATDKNTLNTQKNKDLVSRSLTTPITDDVVSLEIPRVADRAGKYFIFDSSGLPTVGLNADLSDLEAEVDLNTAYKDREKTKVLRTGPFSVVGVTITLDGGEKFSNWNMIEIQFNLDSDSSLFNIDPAVTTLAGINTVRKFSNTGEMTFQRLTDTTFELDSKTVAAGNISRIIGISS